MVFMPGRSGNPLGRASPGDELAKVARRYSTEALGVLVQAMRDYDRNPTLGVAAAREVLDRGHGKPKQDMTVGGDAANELITMHLMAVHALNHDPVIDGPTADPVPEVEEPTIEALLPTTGAAPPPTVAELPLAALPLWQARAVAAQTPDTAAIEDNGPGKPAAQASSSSP